MAAALMPLVLGAPCLQRLKIVAHWNSRDMNRLDATLREGVAQVKEQLAGMGRDPGVVSVLPRPF